MRVPRGRWVAVQQSLPELCPVCLGREAVQQVGSAQMGARLWAPHPALTCPHCSTSDEEQPMPLIYLPMRQDSPRKAADDHSRPAQH